MPPAAQLLIVDSNCFIRLLDWGPRPLLGRTFGGFRLVTTAKLLTEKLSEGLQGRYPALAEPGVRRELEAAKLKFPAKQQKDVDAEAAYFRQEGNRIIGAHCQSQGTFVRTLSAVDASIWAVAAHMKGAIATDEWPLAFAAKAVQADDDGNTIPVLTSVHVLHLLESAGQLSAEERWNTMRRWRLEQELLHRDADAHYRELFGEQPPTAQSRAR